MDHSDSDNVVSYSDYIESAPFMDATDINTQHRGEMEQYNIIICFSRRSGNVKQSSGFPLYHEKEFGTKRAST